VELVINAEGVLPSQLPALELVVPTGIRAYPDTPASKKTLAKSGFRSEWKQSWALIPVRAGRFVLPEMRLHWWDTQHKRFRETVLPEQVFEVIPSGAPQPQVARMTSESAPATRHRSLLEVAGLCFIRVVGSDARMVGLVQTSQGNSGGTRNRGPPLQSSESQQKTVGRLQGQR
ncbi:MAG: hypothetical protein QF614_02865, partial [SAR324 cluster bacterium]|nr:hypothetical protein [SAR324 cluster bacterium]